MLGVSVTGEMLKTLGPKWEGYYSRKQVVTIREFESHLTLSFKR